MANLLDEWDSLDATGGYASDPAALLGDDERRQQQRAFGEPLLAGGASDDAEPAQQQQPIFSLDCLERNAGRGRGEVLAAAAACDCVALVTSRGFLLRYDLSSSSSAVPGARAGVYVCVCVGVVVGGQSRLGERAQIVA